MKQHRLKQWKKSMLPHVRLTKHSRSVNFIFSQIEEETAQIEMVEEQNTGAEEQEATQNETVQEETTAPCEVGAEDIGNDQAKAAEIERAEEDHAPGCESGTEDIGKADARSMVDTQIKATEEEHHLASEPNTEDAGSVDVISTVGRTHARACKSGTEDAGTGTAGVRSIVEDVWNGS